MTGLLVGLAVVYLGVGLAVCPVVRAGISDPVDALVVVLLWPIVILDLFV